MLNDTFLSLLTNYSVDDRLASELWKEIEKNYSSEKRHYHSLQHLENLLLELNEVKTKIQHWNVTMFSLYYHDIVYNVLRTDNEEKSAELAAQRMKTISVPADAIDLCKHQILATQSHKYSADPDTNYFTDADLSVLGKPWETYTQYYRNIRKEYAVYPDLVYNPGRKKVLAHFLESNRIFKTEFFYTKYERQARENLQKETGLL